MKDLSAEVSSNRMVDEGDGAIVLVMDWWSSFLITSTEAGLEGAAVFVLDILRGSDDPYSTPSVSSRWRVERRRNSPRN